jgi:cytochrome b
MRSDHPSKASVLVWDVPTRLFHWMLVFLVALAWVTGEAEGSLFVVHKLAGYGVAVLLVFRVIWGFAGSRHSRFSDFVRPWREVFAHIKGMLSLRPARTFGHNPLGGWMALVLLLVLAAQVTTGCSPRTTVWAGHSPVPSRPARRTPSPSCTRDSRAPCSG